VTQKRIDWAFKVFVGGLFPATLEEPKQISTGVKIVIAFGLIGPAILAEPHIKDLLFCRIFTSPSHEEGERIKNFCDFATLCFQIAIAIVIGGIAITDPAVRSIQTHFRQTDEEDVRNFSIQRRGRLKSVTRIYIDFRYAGIGLTIKNFWPRFKKLINYIWSFVRTIVNSVSEVPNFRQDSDFMKAMNLISLRMRMLFPGGGYGVFSFVLFVGLLMSQVIKTYFDYAPTCK